MKILVVQVGRYGDIILTTPLFHALNQLYPECELHVLAAERYADILNNQPLIDVVHVYRKKVLDVLQSFRSLRSEHFDLYIDPKDHFSQESTFFARVVHSERSIGFNAPGKAIFSTTVPSAEQNENAAHPLHAVDRNLNVVRLLQGPIARRRPILHLSDSQREASLIQAPAFKEGVMMIVLNISAGQQSRLWPESHWIELGKSLAVRGQRMYILAAPSEHDAARRIAAAIGERAGVCATTTIQEAIALIERCHLLVTPDSAPVHIASAFNTPCVALFNSTLWNVHKFRPLSVRHRLVQPERDGEVPDIAVVSVQRACQSLITELNAMNSDTHSTPL